MKIALAGLLVAVVVIVGLFVLLDYTSEQQLLNDYQRALQEVSQIPAEDLQTLVVEPLAKHRTYMMAMMVLLIALLFGSVLIVYLRQIGHMNRKIETQTATIKEIEAKYHLLFSASPEAIFLIDPHDPNTLWPIIDCNEAACTLSGYARKELLGLPSNQLQQDDMSRLRYDALLEQLRTQKTIAQDFAQQKRSGSMASISASFGLVQFGQQELVLRIDRDVSQQRALRLSLQQANKALLALHNTSVVVAGHLNRDDIYQGVIEALERVFPNAYAVTIQALDDTLQKIHTVYVSENVVKTSSRMMFTPGVGVAGHAVANRTVINIADVQTDARFVPGQYPPKFRSLLVAPLITRSRVWGTISIEGMEKGIFQAQDELLANLLARQVAVALENAELYESVQAQREISETLRDISLALAGATSREEVLGQVLAQVARVVPYSAAGIWQKLPSGDYHQTFRLGYDKDQATDNTADLFESEIDESLVLRRVEQTGAIVVIPDTRSDNGWEPISGYEWIRSWVGMPINVHGNLIGVLCLDHTQPDFYNEHYIAILETLSSQISLAVESSVLIEQVQSYALSLQQQAVASAAEVHRQRVQTDAVLHEIGDGVAIIDLRGTINYINPAFGRMLDLLNTEMVGTKVWEYMQKPVALVQLKRIAKSMKLRRKWREEMVAVTRDGRAVTVEINSVPYFEDGNYSGFIVSARDINEVRAVERMKARFLTLVAHELGTPLMNLKLYVHLLSRSHDDPERFQQHLAALETQTDRFDTLMRKILSATRLADLRTLALKEEIEFSSVLDHIDVRYKTLASQKDMILNIEQKPPNLPVIYGDEHWLVLACNELVENAITYTPAHGTVTVSVELESINGRHCAALHVKDTGPGIEATDLAELNAPFIRVGDQETGTTAGIGLGLSIARSVAERHGGSLVVQSTLGEGSTFTLRIPSRGKI